jgi:hypothetical protein
MKLPGLKARVSLGLPGFAGLPMVHVLREEGEHDASKKPKKKKSII